MTSPILRDVVAGLCETDLAMLAHMIYTGLRQDSAFYTVQNRFPLRDGSWVCLLWFPNPAVMAHLAVIERGGSYVDVMDFSLPARTIGGMAVSARSNVWIFDHVRREALASYLLVGVR